MKIGIFVGSFNPVHVGHIKIIQELLNKKYVDRVYIVPTMPYWNKNDLIDLNDRINMLKIVSNDEIVIDCANNKLEYTYQILDIYHEKYPIYDIKLIIGADNLVNLNKWMNYDKILKYGVIVIGRNKLDITPYLKDSIIVTDIPETDISSTEIRNNKFVRDKYLDPKVLKYIKDNGLYN